MWPFTTQLGERTLKRSVGITPAAVKGNHEACIAGAGHSGLRDSAAIGARIEWRDAYQDQMRIAPAWVGKLLSRLRSSLSADRFDR